MTFHTAGRFIEEMNYMDALNQVGWEALELTVKTNHTPKDAEEIMGQLKGEVRFIEVDGYFGKKKVSKDDFAEEWVEHTKQLWRITYERDWMERVSEIVEEVRTRAEYEFDKLWTEANAVED